MMVSIGKKVGYQIMTDKMVPSIYLWGVGNSVGKTIFSKRNRDSEFLLSPCYYCGGSDPPEAETRDLHALQPGSGDQDLNDALNEKACHPSSEGDRLI